jgi:glycosyltransferase involved in cell wall biosynthesis
MRTVWEAFPEAVLLLAGQRAHREPAVTKMLAHPTAADRCRVVLIDDFAAEDAASIMDACDLLALPSVEEAFGLVMIEAWMCGKPVIGADIASTRCIIDSGVDGWTAKPLDVSSLADRILDLLADPAKRAAFGERGRQSAGTLQLGSRDGRLGVDASSGQAIGSPTEPVAPRITELDSVR